MSGEKSPEPRDIRALSASDVLIVRAAVERALADLKDALEAIDEDRQATADWLAFYRRVSQRPKDPEWTLTAEEESGEEGPGLRDTPQGWRQSCAELAAMLEDLGLTVQTRAIHQLLASAPQPVVSECLAPRAGQKAHRATDRGPEEIKPEDPLVARRVEEELDLVAKAWQAEEKAVRGLLGFLQALAGDLAAATAERRSRRRKELTRELSELLTWVKANLKGKQRRVMELVIDGRGECPLSTIAIDAQVSWVSPYDNAFNGICKALNPKLKKAGGWRIQRSENKARVAKIGQK